MSRVWSLVSAEDALWPDALLHARLSKYLLFGPAQETHPAEEKGTQRDFSASSVRRARQRRRSVGQASPFMRSMKEDGRAGDVNRQRHGGGTLRREPCRCSIQSPPSCCLPASRPPWKYARPSESSAQVDGLPIFDESGLPPSSRVGVRLRCTGSISARASIVTSATWPLAMAPRGTPGYVHERPHQADLR